MRILWRVVVVLVLLAALVGIGVYAYNWGVTQGLAQKVAAQGGQTVPAPYPGYWPPFWGFGYGFGFLGCLIPLFLLFLIFGSMRMLLWGGHMGWRRRMHGPWGWRGENDKGVPPFFDEWHRRAHGEKTPDDEPGKPS